MQFRVHFWDIVNALTVNSLSYRLVGMYYRLTDKMIRLTDDCII